MGLSIAFAVLVLLAGVGFWLWWIFAGSEPALDGHMALAGLARPVEIQRDAAGVPTITAENRLDLARALGFVHGQERYFQMDLLRRSGAGELSELVGAAALPIDTARRRHRFRSRAEALLERMPAAHRQLLEAYAAGVNAGLGALRHRPFEYTMLRTSPQPWRAEDTLLCVYAMYFELQDSTGWTQIRTSMARTALGPALADFLYASHSPDDASLDGSVIPAPLMPGETPPPAPAPDAAPTAPPPPVKGSNSFAVSGAHTATGAAIVANDMHLQLRMPNTWYRARLRVGVAGKLAEELDGVTLPGTPMLVTGSNGKVAWGFTDSYIATGDAILLDPVEGDADAYATPDGPKKFVHVTERLCPIRAQCQDLPIEETIWGPVVAHAADGRRIVWRWVAQDGNAVDLTGLLALETAGNVREALDAAHKAGLPQQNMVIGDSEGHIAWTVIGHIPKRIGLADDTPQSWADGTRGWQGYLSPDQIPEVIDPPDGLIWSANNRMISGDGLALLGTSGFDTSDRARQIHDDLKARDKFAESDLLAIQLDARAPALAGWQTAMMAALSARRADPRYSAMIPYVKDWGGAALPGSVGYRLVRSFEQASLATIYGGLAAPLRPAALGSLIGTQAEAPSLRLLTERPASLVPPPYRDWNAATDAILADVSGLVDAAGGLEAFTWGARNHAGIHHPLTLAASWLGKLTDPPDEPLPGDALQPRVVTPGFGASERFDVSPGHEGDGILEMPGGEAGDPLTPYYLAGHDDWAKGRPSPFLPGPAKWTLVLEPAG